MKLKKDKKEAKCATPKKAMPPKKRKILIIAIACTAALFAVCTAGVVAVNSTENIFPRVSVDGVSVGGMNEMQALSAIGEVYPGDADEIELVVELPLDNRLVVTGAEAGLAVSAQERAFLAWEYCHGGNAVSNALTYLKCMLFGMSLDSTKDFVLDEESIRAKIEGITQEVRISLMSSDLEIGEDSIAVVKGASDVTLDADEIYALIENAFITQSYETIVYEAKIAAVTEIDLQGIYDTIYSEAQDAFYDKETDSIISHTVGMQFDVSAAQAIWNAAEYGERVIIPVETTQPDITAEYLEGVLFADCLSSKATSLSGSSSNRINNIALASEAINGLVLMPGEMFDYNVVVGERTAARGYLPAGAYSGGQTVQEYGGGICQVSSTIYYCALYSNLEISTRLCHMFPVNYLPPGLDAAVSWGGPEFRFVNVREYPIKIYAYVTDNATITVEIWGTDVDGSYVEMTYSTAYVFHDVHTDIAIGYRAWTYRNVYDKDGVQISREREASSYYGYYPENINLPEEEEEVPEPSASPSPDPDVPTTPDATPTPPEPTTEAPQDTPPAEPTPELPENPEPTQPVGEGE